MIGFLDILSFGLEWGYVLVFCWMLHTFLPLRRNRALRVLAFFACSFLAPAVIYSNDLPGLIGVLTGFGPMWPCSTEGGGWRSSAPCWSLAPR